MIQINNGFNDCYYLQTDGTIYNTASGELIKPNKQHLFVLKTIDNAKQKIALKTLYKAIYNKPFCDDQIADLNNEQWK